MSNDKNKTIIEAAKKIKDWRKDPVQFVRDNFQAEPDLWQQRVLVAFVSGDRDKVRISMQACAGPGKSAVLAWCAWIFLSCYGEKGEHPKGAAISITWDNLMDNFWVELSKWQQRSEYLLLAFKWTKTRIFAVDHPSTWFLTARSFPKAADKEELGKTLSGMHGKYVAFFIDESGAIPPEVGRACEQAVGEALKNNGFIKVIQAGNPLTIDGLLYTASVSSDTYVVRITGDPDDPERSPRIDEEWAKEQIDKYGRDNPWVMSYILGKFPKSALNTLLSLDEVMDAMDRHLPEDAYSFSQKRLGVDVARFGLDSTVIFPRQGLAAFKFITMEQATSDLIAARVANSKLRWGSEMELIDGTGGYGSGVVDSLRIAGHSPYEINFAGKASTTEYVNIRAEMWFRMAEWVKGGGSLPNDARLKKELCAPMYFFNKGKFQLEAKDQIKKRLGFSPDIADALALTFAMPEMRARDKLMDSLTIGKNRVAAEYDPFADKRF